MNVGILELRRVKEEEDMGHVLRILSVLVCWRWLHLNNGECFSIVNFVNLVYSNFLPSGLPRMLSPLNLRLLHQMSLDKLSQSQT